MNAMHLLISRFKDFKEYFKKVYQQIKIILSNKDVQTALIVCSVAVSLYTLGRYRAKLCVLQTQIEPLNTHDAPQQKETETAPTTKGVVLTSFLSDQYNNVKYWLFPGDDTQRWGHPLNSYYPYPYPNKRSASRIMEVMKYGFPGSDNLRFCLDYVVSYNNTKKLPNWVYEHFTSDRLMPNEDLDACNFRPFADRYIHPYFRSKLSDFRRSGYLGRFLAHPSQHQEDKEQLREVYHMSNVVPQSYIGCWTNLVEHVQELTETHPNVYCCTGTLFLPKEERDGKRYVQYELIGKNQVAVPSHFFKVVIADNKDGDDLEMESYMMENKRISPTTPLNELYVEPEFIEKKAGLTFVNSLHKDKVKTINGKHNPEYRRRRLLERRRIAKEEARKNIGHRYEYIDTDGEKYELLPEDTDDEEEKFDKALAAKNAKNAPQDPKQKAPVKKTLPGEAPKDPPQDKDLPKGLGPNAPVKKTLPVEALKDAPQGLNQKAPLEKACTVKPPKGTVQALDQKAPVKEALPVASPKNALQDLNQKAPVAKALSSVVAPKNVPHALHQKAPVKQILPVKPTKGPRQALNQKAPVKKPLSVKARPKHTPQRAPEKKALPVEAPKDLPQKPIAKLYSESALSKVGNYRAFLDFLKRKCLEFGKVLRRLSRLRIKDYRRRSTREYYEM